MVCAPVSTRLLRHPSSTHRDELYKSYGYVRMPPVEETMAAHLCSSLAKTLDSSGGLLSKP